MDNINILIVEDEVIVAKDIELTLANLGYSVSGSVSSGKDAIDHVKNHRPDLVLMDIMLEGKLDGIETANIIHQQFSVPVIFLTAYSNENTLERAKTAKPYGYILKPFQETDLYTSIEIAIYKYNIERKLIEETENALAAIIGSTEVLLEDCNPKYDQEILRRIESIRNAVLVIKETIEKI